MAYIINILVEYPTAMAHKILYNIIVMLQILSWEETWLWVQTHLILFVCCIKSPPEQVTDVYLHTVSFLYNVCLDLSLWKMGSGFIFY